MTSEGEILSDSDSYDDDFDDDCATEDELEFVEVLQAFNGLYYYVQRDGASSPTSLHRSIRSSSPPVDEDLYHETLSK